MIGLFIAIIPVPIQKQQQDTYAYELRRTAELSGRVGEETNKRAQELSAETGLDPTITWSKTGDNDITVTLQTTVNIGFGGLGSFPVQLISKSSGKSEVYWK